MDWKNYQEEAASFFRNLGLEAETDVTVEGVRTKHDIDVLVKSHHVGFDITWVVECKYWKSPVSKLHVLALREIVSDLGADRGILLSESGFQSGAFEAAKLTNIQLTSLGNMEITAKEDFSSMKLRELYDLVIDLKNRYWAIPKYTRMEHGLRPDRGGYGYSANLVLDAAEKVISKAFRNAYPFEVEWRDSHAIEDMPSEFSSHEQVLCYFLPHIEHAKELIVKVEEFINERK